MQNKNDTLQRLLQFTIAEFGYANCKTLNIVMLMYMQVATRKSMSPHK
jgi:hypothetical protein